MLSHRAFPFLLAGAMACGTGAAMEASGDAGADAPNGDAASVDAGGIQDAIGFISDAPFDAGPMLAMAAGACDPPCPAGDYCYAYVLRGGGAAPLVTDAGSDVDGAPDDGGDAGVTLGCYAVPAACEPDASCGCLVPAVKDACHASVVDCIVDDAGRPTVECIFLAP